MSELLTAITSKPSRVHNLAYIIFGYVFASALVSTSHIESLSDYLLLVGLMGGFIGTFLFYIKPVERLLSIILGRPGSLSSPFITEMKGKIIGGTYFSLSLFIISFNPNLRKLILGYPWLQPSLLVAAIVVFLINLYDARKLPDRVRVIDAYYRYVGEVLNPLHRSVAISVESLGSFKAALARGDWLEAAEFARHLVQATD